MITTVLLVAVIFCVRVLISTGVLTGALFITGEEQVNRGTLLKCLALTTVTTAVAMIPYFGLISVVIWIGGLMAVFEKEFLEALLISITCLVINIVVGFGLALLLAPFMAAA